MAKAIPDAVLDVFLNAIAAGNRISVLSGQPADFAAIAGLTMANGVALPGNGNGYTHANGDVSGRKTIVGQQLDLAIIATGTATHVSIDDGTNLILVTTTTAQPLTFGGTVTIPAFDVEISDPT
jgi:hypothetical protein